MKTHMTRGLILVMVLFGLLLLGAPTGAAQANGVSPEKFLNPDGTLNLDGSFRGALDLSGYHVTIDPQRGPILDTNNSSKASLVAGDWHNLGSGGGPIRALVRAIAVDGDNVYVGGSFRNVNSDPAADYIVKWDGAHWSGLGQNSLGDGALNREVTAIAIDAAGNLYVGGYFLNAGDNSAADYIARWDGASWSAMGSNGAADGALNANVFAIATQGTAVYIGGQFTNVNNNGVPVPEADYLARWDGSLWSAVGHNGSGDGSLSAFVKTLAVSGSDLYIGGAFTNVTDNGVTLTAADYIARWDGANWHGLGSNGAANGALNHGVWAIALGGGGELYAGGGFTNVNNNGVVLPTADYVARWDGADWTALGDNGAGTGSLNSDVYSLLVVGNDVYMGGTFTDVNNQGTILTAADYLVRWDGANWTALGSDGSADGSLLSSVHALAANGTTLYAGGDFPYVENSVGEMITAASSLAQWDGADWSAVDPAAPTNGSLNGMVYALAVQGTAVYVGGSFMNVIDQDGVALPEADFIAKWDGEHWSALGSNGAGDGALDRSVACLVIGPDGALYVGGSFTNVRNGAVLLSAADYLARWDGENWTAVGAGADGNGALNNVVNAITFDGDEMIVGGAFTNVNDNGTALPEADYIARWDGAHWSALGSDGAGNGALNQRVEDIAITGGGVFAGGWFTDVNNNGAPLPEADYVARWDPLAGSWSALGSDGAGNGALNNFVYVLQPDAAGNLYVGGMFINAGGVAEADQIARWDGAGWHALGSNGAGDGALGGGSVHAIEIDGTDIYVGGNFANVNSGAGLVLEADYITKWDGAQWSALGSNGAENGALNAYAQAIKRLDDDLYVGGGFVDVNNNGVVNTAADFVAVFAPPDIVPPVVESITRADANPTVAPGVDFAVTFSEKVVGVDESDFALTTTGSLTGAVVSVVRGAGMNYVVTVFTGTGAGTLRLDVVDDDSILDMAGNPLGGVGVDNGSFTGGEVYDVRLYALYLPLILR